MKNIKQLISAGFTLLFRGCAIYNSKVSRKAVVRKKCRIYNSTIDDYSYVTRNTLIHNTQIGKYCSISEDCAIGSISHPLDMVSTSPVFLEGRNYFHKHFAHFKHDGCRRTVIGNDVWIGMKCLIKDGITIGDGAVIGMGSIVTKDVGPYEIWAGVPARKIRSRFDQGTVRKLMEIRWWDWPEEKIVEYAESFDDPKSLIEITDQLELK